MNYRHILTYNFSDDDTRSSFVELIEGLGYIKAEDQSTYVLPYDSSTRLRNLISAIQIWITGNNPDFVRGDFVQLFYLKTYKVLGSEQTISKIASKYMPYNPLTKSLI